MRREEEKRGARVSQSKVPFWASTTLTGPFKGLISFSNQVYKTLWITSKLGKLHIKIKTKLNYTIVQLQEVIMAFKLLPIGVYNSK